MNLCVIFTTYVFTWYTLRSLARNSRLAFLDISSNSIGDEGAVRLSEALIFNRTLRELNLENCSIFPTGCAALSRALKANTSLRSLQLSRNAIEDSGMRALADGLKYNGALETLCVNMCSVGNSGFGRLLDALRGNATLTTVKLCYNFIGGGTSASPRRADVAGGDEVRRPPSLEELHGRLRAVLHHSPKLKILLWGNCLDAFPAFRAYTDMDGGKTSSTV